MGIKRWIGRCIQYVRAHPESLALFVLSIVAGVFLTHKVSSRPLWMDEEAVLWYVHMSPLQFFQHYIVVPDDHAPLYYMLVLLIYRAFPYGVAALRAVSVISAIGIVMVTYLYGRLVFTKKSYAFGVAAAVSFSSYFLLIGQMARYHAVAALGALVAFYALGRMVLTGYERRWLIWYVIAGMFVCLNDYPHFVYLVVVSNLYFFVQLLRKKAPVPLGRWLLAQGILAATFIPMVLLILQRLTFSPELGFSNASLLGNSFLHIALGLLMHGYVYFFGENILPWNVLPFALGVVALILTFSSIVRGMVTKKDASIRWIGYLVVSLVIVNTLFMNFVDPRYNFIVYPKFGFVAYPLFLILVGLGIERMQKWYIRFALAAICLVIAMWGTVNFYQGRNYLNGSYFGTFVPYQIVEQNALPGDWLVINGDVNAGLYAFYANSYFRSVRPIALQDVAAITARTSTQRLWFFSTGSDGDGANQTPESKIPEGLRILFRYDSTPLDPTLKKYKEKILHRASYTYKYGLFLLTNH